MTFNSSNTYLRPLRVDPFGPFTSAITTHKKRGLGFAGTVLVQDLAPAVIMNTNALNNSTLVAKPATR